MDHEFLALICKLAYLGTNLNPYWKLPHLRKFLGHLFFFEEHVTLRSYLESEDTQATIAAETTTTTPAQLASASSTTDGTTDDVKMASASAATTNVAEKKLKSSLKLVSRITGKEISAMTFKDADLSCDDLKLSSKSNQAGAVLGICEESNSLIFSPNELNIIDIGFFKRNKQSLKLLEDCTEKLTKFDSSNVTLPKSNPPGTNKMANGYFF